MFFLGSCHLISVHTSVSASAFLPTALLSPPPAVFFSISPLRHPFPSSWPTSILPLTPRGSSNLSLTTQEIPLPITLITSQTFPIPQSCHPTRTNSNQLSSNPHPNSPPLVPSPRMTSIRRNNQTSRQLQNPTNPAIQSPRLPSLQNFTRKWRVSLRILTPSVYVPCSLPSI